MIQWKHNFLIQHQICWCADWKHRLGWIKKSLINLFPTMVPTFNQTMKIMTSKGNIGEIKINGEILTKQYEYKF